MQFGGAALFFRFVRRARRSYSLLVSVHVSGVTDVSLFNQPFTAAAANSVTKMRHSITSFL